jgi:hypothetical protein
MPNTKRPGQRFNSKGLELPVLIFSVSGGMVLILVAVGVISFALVLALIFARLMRKTTGRAHEAQERQLEHDQRRRQASYAQATVLGVSSSTAIGLSEVKVDLRLEVQPVGISSYNSETTWLVELAWLAMVQPGKTIQVRIDSDDPLKIYPGADWAKLWLWD